MKMCGFYKHPVKVGQFYSQETLVLKQKRGDMYEKVMVLQTSSRSRSILFARNIGFLSKNGVICMKKYWL